MAKKKDTSNTTTCDNQNVVANNGDSIFQPFQWHHPDTETASLPGGAAMRFAGLVLDVACGIQTILEVTEQERIDDGFRADADETQPPPMLDDNSRSRLERLAIASLQMLSNESESLMRWAYESHTKQGRQERAKQAAYAAGTLAA